MKNRLLSRQDRPPQCLAQVPVGDPAERCVAHLMLALFACHLRLAESARLHMARAAEAIDAPDHPAQTLRGVRDTRVVRVLTIADDLSAAVLLPVIAQVAIVPEIAFETVLQAMRCHDSRTTTVSFCDIIIDRVRLRLRTERVKEALRDIRSDRCLESHVAGLERLLNQCISPALTQVTPLDYADELFELAARLAHLGNRALAQLALQKANSQLQLHARTTNDVAFRRRWEGLTQNVAGLVDGLRASAS